MPAKHLSDILFDYLFETNDTLFPDKETGMRLKNTGEAQGLKNKDTLPDTKEE